MTRIAVLSVDDSSDDTLLLRNACKRSKTCFDLIIVRDGLQAIDYLSGAEPYADRSKFPIPVLILLDLNMPRMNGFEVLEWLRNHSELNHLPVTVFTSSQHETDVRNAYKKGANCFLMKPVDFDELTKLVQSISCAINNAQDLSRTLSTSRCFRPCI